MPRVVSLFPNIRGSWNSGTKQGTDGSKGLWKREVPQRSKEQSKTQLAHYPGCNASLKSLQNGCEGIILPHACSQFANSDPSVPYNPSNPCGQFSPHKQPMGSRAGDGKGTRTEQPPHSAPKEQGGHKSELSGQRQVSELPLNWG